MSLKDEFIKIGVPTSEELAQELIERWETIFQHPFEELRGVLAAAEVDHNHDILYLIRKGEALAGTCHLTISKSNPELGGLGEVTTSPEFRSMGIAATLCEQARDEFRAVGGQALFLGTINPGAARIYNRLGWVKLAGANVMALITAGESPEEFLVDYFRSGGSVQVTTGTPAHRIPMIPLILSAHEWQVLDANVNLFSTRYVVQNSCMGLYPRYEELSQGGGVWFSARTDGGRLVGLSTVVLDEPGRCWVDGFTHRNYSNVWEELIGAAMDWGFGQGATSSLTALSSEDDSKKVLFESLGFRETGTGDDFDLDGRMVKSIHLEKLREK